MQSTRPDTPYFTLRLRNKDGTMETQYIAISDIKSVIISNSNSLYLHLTSGFYGPMKNATMLQNDLAQHGVKTFITV